MFHRRTLFVVGAGASVEAGMPTGPELAAMIGKKMDIRFAAGYEPVGGGDFQLYNQMKIDRPPPDARAVHKEKDAFGVGELEQRLHSL